MAAKKYVQCLTQYLAGSGVIIGATNIVLTSLTDIYGNAITSIASFGDKGYITLEPDTTNEEAATFTSIVVNANGTVTLGGVSTVLAQSPYTETSGLVRAHSGGTKVVVTDNVAFWNTFANKNNDEVISGRWSTTTVPVNPNDVATKSYADGLAIAGAPNASTSVQGLVQEATQAQVLAKTVTGSTGAKLFAPLDKVPSTLVSDYKADTGVANAYAIAPTPAITAYVIGQTFSFKTTNANTLTSTLNVNGLGVKTITRLDGTALAPNDIIAGAMYTVIYDGVNFQLQNPTCGNTPSGASMMFDGAVAPAGWLLKDGASYLRATFPGLFAAIGTTFGSADGTHFNVPDTRGRIPIGVGTGTGGGANGTGLPTGGSALTAVPLGGWKGEETHTMTTGELVAHTHPVPTVSGTTGNGVFISQGTTNANNVNVTSGSTGSSTPFNVIQPVMGTNFIIKT